MYLQQSSRNMFTTTLQPYHLLGRDEHKRCMIVFSAWTQTQGSSQERVWSCGFGHWVSQTQVKKNLKTA